MTGIRVGDEVRVYQQRRFTGGRSNGEPGVVVKVGRKLATIRCNGWAADYRMDSGFINDRYGHWWFETRGQAEAREREEAAMAVLAAAGLEVKMGHRLAPGLAEVAAAAVEAFGQEG